MYVQISTKCNMSCSHCGMSCTKKGQDMSLATFKRCIDFDSCISIGGGEPTIHPQFWEFLGIAMGTCELIWLATNGSMTDTSIALAELAKKGVISCDLSLDPFHDPIDPRVIEAFTKDNLGFSIGWESDSRHIRNTSDNLIKAGRCKDGVEGCICEDFFIKPDGTVKGCGCDNAIVLGNINDPTFEMPDTDEWEWNVCSKKQTFKKKVA